MKLLYQTKDGRTFTMGKFMYSPHLNLPNNYHDFSNNLEHQIGQIHRKYEIKKPGLIKTTLAFDDKYTKVLSQYKVSYPFPERLIQDQRDRVKGKIGQELSKIRQRGEDLRKKLNHISDPRS